MWEPVDGTELDGAEPVGHKDPGVVQLFQTYFGVIMTFQQVMGLFEKGEASSTFVHSGKVMAFDIAAVSNAMTLPDCTKVGECTMFYGNVVRRRPDLQPLRGRRNVRGFATCSSPAQSKLTKQLCIRKLLKGASTFDVGEMVVCGVCGVVMP